MPHLLKGMNLYIVELSYTVFNENVIICVTFFVKKVTFFVKNKLFLYDVLEVPRGLGRSGKVSRGVLDILEVFYIEFLIKMK